MKLLSIASIVLAAALSSAPASANPQHDRMRACNAEAKEKSLKGDDRKAFMKTCLSASKKAATEKTANTVRR